MSIECIDREKKKVLDYQKKVFFFSVFSKILQDAGIKVKVEPKCVQNNGNNCYPDFHCRINGYNFIFEHKGSLSNKAEYIQKEITDTERYLDLKKREAAKEVVLLVPEKDLKKAKKTLENLSSQLCIWSFDFNLDKEILIFKEQYNKCSSPEYAFLLERPIEFDITWCSFKRFLRDEPPVVYSTSFICNHVLYSFLDIWKKSDEPFDIEFENVVTVSQQWYPGTEEANQITSKRVKLALQLLNEIGWVEYPNNNNGVTVKGIKRLREKLIPDILCAALCKMREGDQSSLDEFFPV
ncbi:MAG: hypothetical protein ACTSV2_19140 [Candidatus Thorarchaeota archaeon]